MPFDFNSISGLKLDINPAVGTYKDPALTQPCTADGDVVGGVVDQSSNGYVGTQSTTANKPIYKVSPYGISYPVLRFDGSNDWLDFPGAAALADASGVFIVVMQQTGAGAVGIVGSGGTASDRFFTVSVEGAAMAFNQRNADTQDRLTTGNLFTSTYIHIGAWKSDGSTYTADFDGAAKTFSSILSGANNGDWLGDTANRTHLAVGSFYYGSSSNLNFPGDILRLLYYSPVPSGSDLATIYNELGKLYGIIQVNFSGDSLTAGGSTTSPYPQQCLDLLSRRFFGTNFGVAGTQVASMDTTATASVDPLYRAALATNWSVLWGGTNDIGIGGRSASQIETDITTFCTNRRNAGYKVAVCSIIARDDAGWGGSGGANEATRQAVNTWLRANWQTIADKFIDLAALPEFDNIADASNTTNYNADKLHLTNAGNTVVATAIKTELLIQDLDLPLLSASSTLYAPTVTRDQGLALPLLSASSTLYAPTVTQDQALALPLLSVSSTLYAPVIGQEQVLNPPLLSASFAIYAPFIGQEQVVTPPLLAASSTLYTPTIGQDQTLALPLLSASSALYAPTIVIASRPTSLTLSDRAGATLTLTDFSS